MTTLPATIDENGSVSGTSATKTAPDKDVSELINASGHVQELDRNFNLLAAAGVGLVVGSEMRR